MSQPERVGFYRFLTSRGFQRRGAARTGEAQVVDLWRTETETKLKRRKNLSVTNLKEFAAKCPKNKIKNKCSKQSTYKFYINLYFCLNFLLNL